MEHYERRVSRSIWSAVRKFCYSRRSESEGPWYVGRFRFLPGRNGAYYTWLSSCTVVGGERKAAEGSYPVLAEYLRGEGFLPMREDAYPPGKRNCPKMCPGRNCGGGWFIHAKSGGIIACQQRTRRGMAQLFISIEGQLDPVQMMACITEGK